MTLTDSFSYGRLKRFESSGVTTEIDAQTMFMVQAERTSSTYAVPSSKCELTWTHFVTSAPYPK